MCTLTNSRGRPFGPGGCQVPVGSGVCGESRTLDIVNEFKRLYEEKMQEIDTNGGGDCLQEKFRLQQEWIGDLTEQNELLVRAVEELEHEATERVKILEQKLQQSAQCICEVMKRYREYDFTNDILDGPRKRIFNLENDQKNLLEFIRRIRTEQRWTIDGLTFYEVNHMDLLGKKDEDSCLRFTDDDHYKVEAKILEKEGTITKLQAKVDYVYSFGDIEELSKELKKKMEECDSLKQTMVDMRQALTEEVASKHDTVLQLKRDCLDLEERCVQADKQTAFRDDIIKELRKEIKHLKQQVNQEEIMKLNRTIDELKNTLQNTRRLQEDEENVQTNLDGDDGAQHKELLKKRDDVIRVQTETLKLLQDQASKMKEAEVAMKDEKERLCLEIQRLKTQVDDLRGELRDSNSKGTNLQMAVDLYMNSINVLECTEEKYKLEIDQQRTTISNLQSALVAVKQELDDMRSKKEDNEKDQHLLINNCVSYLTNIGWEKENIAEEFDNVCNKYEKLQDTSFSLEMDHCNSLLDVEILEQQLFKYQHLLRLSENDNGKYKNDLKKLMKQKKCYEEVIIYFREEITLMSEQLHNLQELLTLSNESAQAENSNLVKAFLEVQTANEKLARQLCAAEQKVLLENQMNQLNESKIDELERMISEKEIDLGKHDQAISNIRDTLRSSMRQNEELHAMITALNGTICQLHGAIKKYEIDNGRSRESTANCQSQIAACKQKLQELKSSLDQKTAELCKLEMAYSDQNRTLQSTQMELKEMRERQKDKQGHMRLIIEELKEKLGEAEAKLKTYEEEHGKLQNHLALVVRRETVKDVEIKRYRKIVGDLKKTLIDLNKALTNKKLQNKCNNAECKKNMVLTDIGDPDFNDICLNCPCEVEFYQNLVETLKRTVLDLKAKLMETQKKNEQMEEEKAHRDQQLEHLTKTKLEKEKEYNELRQRFAEKMNKSQSEEARYSELATQFERELGCLRQELELRTMQLNEVKKNSQEIHSSRCVQLACAQEEVGTLKEELNNLLRKHCALNVENEKLHNQSARMQSTVSSLEKKSQLLSGQLEQYLIDLQTVQCDKEALIQKNRELLAELRSLQSSYVCADKQQRYTNESIKHLEGELFKVKGSRDDLCAESKNIISYFRAWLQEQKRINEYVGNKEKNYINTIEKLRQENDQMQQQYFGKQAQKGWEVNVVPCRTPVSPTPMCQSPWSMESQGSTSGHDNSPSRSPCLNQDCDWYSTTFKNESEEEEDEDWVSRVEDLAAQVRRTNKMWKNKMGNNEFAVTRDQKK